VGRALERSTSLDLESKSLHGVYFFLSHVFAFSKMYPIEFPLKGKRNDSFISVSPELHKYHLGTVYYAHHLFSRYHNVFWAALRERNFNIR
jgi:hypothetical protein